MKNEYDEGLFDILYDNEQGQIYNNSYEKDAHSDGNASSDSSNNSSSDSDSDSSDSSSDNDDIDMYINTNNTNTTTTNAISTNNNHNNDNNHNKPVEDCVTSMVNKKNKNVRKAANNKIINIINKKKQSQSIQMSEYHITTTTTTNKMKTKSKKYINLKVVKNQDDQFDTNINSNNDTKTSNTTSNNNTYTSNNGGGLKSNEFHKCLIFAQHCSVLDIIETCILKRYFTKIHYERIDGTIPLHKRTNIIESFNNEHDIESIRMLLCTTATCGLGKLIYICILYI